jgi:hypothetical protein
MSVPTRNPYGKARSGIVLRLWVENLHVMSQRQVTFLASSSMEWTTLERPIKVLHAKL